MSTDHVLNQLDAELGPASSLRHHVLRRHGDALLDLPLAPSAGSRVWAATLWRSADGTWQRSLWTVGPRGFRPSSVHYGDVIEFGVHNAKEELTVWYGHLTDVTDDAVILTGPYPTPEDARPAAGDALARWQANQLNAHQRRRRPQDP